MRRLLAIAALIASAGCGSDEPTSPMPSNSLVVTPTRLALGVGLSRRLTASVLDQSGTPVSGATVTFATSDAGVVSVTDDGLVTYVGAGQAEITATSDDLIVVVPCTGLRAGHPLGTSTTSATLPGVVEGDAPFGVAVDGDGRVFITQAHAGHVASSFYPVSPLTGFATHDLDGTPTSIALLGGRRALVTPTGPDNDDASVIDLTSNRVLAEVTLDVAVFAAVTAPDTQTAWLGTNDGRVLKFDVASSRVTGSIPLNVEKSRANHLAINAAGTLLYASSFTSGSVSEIDLSSETVARTFFVAGEPQGVAVSPDGAELYLADESGTGSIHIYGLAEATLELSIPSGATSGRGGPFGLAMSPDGTAVYVGVITGDGPGLIQVIDVATRTIEHTLTSCGEIPRRIAFGYSGGLAVIPDETGCANFVE